LIITKLLHKRKIKSYNRKSRYDHLYPLTRSVTAEDRNGSIKHSSVTSRLVRFNPNWRASPSLNCDSDVRQRLELYTVTLRGISLIPEIIAV